MRYENRREVMLIVGSQKYGDSLVISLFLSNAILLPGKSPRRAAHAAGSRLHARCRHLDMDNAPSPWHDFTDVKHSPQRRLYEN